jgi:hypothetical protein
MAKVSRAARVASRQRVETLTGAKTIESAEAGETYLITTVGTITLPALQDGAYFKFVFQNDLAGLQTGKVTIAGKNSTDYMVGMGSVNHIGVDFETHIPYRTAGAAKAADTHDTLVITDTVGDVKKVFAGSWIECWSDGTYWYVSYELLVDHTTQITATFA